ncbi:MAG: response regulator transcription factor [Thermomicrobiales bacterium]|nr:response regulator transcription factor [Thermomicrobiales bacterium]MCO5221395.1 response regulator transcription factor [Thermomicrobiales bacterium]
MTDRDPLRILIVDDHPLFRKGVSALIGVQPDMELADAADGMHAAVDLALSLQPDVVLMDLQLPDGSGIQATRTIVADSPAIRVLIVTMFEDDDSVFAALRAGARGYVLKGTAEDDLLRAIRSVAAGEAIFSPTIASRVLTYFNRPAPVPLFPNLTDREREILTLIAQGKNNQTIARDLFLSPKTIANHVSNIFSKLQVADRSEAIIRARDAGLA